MDFFIDTLVDMLLPSHHRALFAIPLALVFLALLLYGSHAIRSVMVSAAFTLTLLVFSVTLNHALRFLPTWLRVLLAVALSAVCAVFAAQSAASGGVGLWTTTALGFAFGTVAAGVADTLGADFHNALPGHPALAAGCACLCFGLTFARVATFAPSLAAAASTALVGARGVAACLRLASPQNVEPIKPSIEAFITISVALVGFLAQLWAFQPRRGSVDALNVQRGYQPYDEI